jgi:hypothetical protein
MLRFKKFSNNNIISEGFGEGGDTNIGALSPPATKKTKIKAESGASFSRSDFIEMHTESGPPKFNKRAEHGGFSFYGPHERKH